MPWLPCCAGCLLFISALVCPMPPFYTGPQSRPWADRPWAEQPRADWLRACRFACDARGDCKRDFSLHGLRSQLLGWEAAG